MAYHLARWVQAWHSAEDKLSLQVKTRPSRFLPQAQTNEDNWTDTSMIEATNNNL
jgi:hypothetical protein